MTLNGDIGVTQQIALPHGQTPLFPLQFLTLIEFTIMKDRHYEKMVAVGSFLAAVGLAFTSLIISDDHDIAAGVLMMCAQFLTLTATIFGIDYKFTSGLRGSKDDR